MAKIRVQDANGDKYDLDFEVENTEDGIALICPWCGERLSPDAAIVACANGHLAYTVIDEEVTEKAIAELQ